MCFLFCHLKGKFTCSKDNELFYYRVAVETVNAESGSGVLI